ncbi:hypothetical protein [Serratia symbiotica]
MYALPESCPFRGLFYSKFDLFNKAHYTLNNLRYRKAATQRQIGREPI